ncbi:MAG: DNA/RNA non-specific endonuclease [Paludibacteraceae bacterium]|nr:DNA/RNA non-specific endonuclease [Paludibacteraceae bacterium]
MKKTLTILTLAVAGLLVVSYVYNKSHTSAQTATQSVERQMPGTIPVEANIEIPRWVTEQAEQYIEHTGYTVSYNPKRKIPNWVAYCLESAEVAGTYSRTDKFVPDPMVKGDKVVTKDYSGSGYDRGHMAPAADMRWSEQAMRESFYMTNICPQNHNNNAGDWKDLEELVRDLSTKYGNIYICCGPIVTDENETIGKERKIVVPQAFFKVLLRQKKDGGWTAIGFVMPNAAGNRPLMTYMKTIDEVEEMTGIDFYPALPDDTENAVEADYTVSDWTL